MRGLFDVHVGGLGLLCVHDVEVVVALHFPDAALYLVGVKHQYRHALLIPGVVAEYVHEPRPRGVQVVRGQLFQLVPGENHVVAVNQQVFWPFELRPCRAALGVRLRRLAPFHRAHGADRVAADGAVGALEYRHQLLVRGQRAAVVRRPCGTGGGVRALRCGAAEPLVPGEDAGQVHTRGHLVPAHQHARPVAAKHRVRRVRRVGSGVVAHGGDDLLRVVAALIAARQADELPAPARVRRHLPGVAAQGRHRGAAFDKRLLARRDRSLELGAQPWHVRQRASDGLLRQAQREVIPRLQKHALSPLLRGAQSLPHGAVGGLAEVPALRVLGVRPPGGQRDLHVGQRRAGQRAQMRLLGQVREYKPLPVRGQVVLPAGRGQLYAAARLAGFEQEVHLRVVAQRLVVADALHPRAYRLLVQYSALVEAHFQAEAALYKALQHFKLHLAHQLELGFSQALVPDHAQHRVFLLQLAQLPHGQGRVAAWGQYHAVAQNWLQRR